MGASVIVDMTEGMNSRPAVPKEYSAFQRLPSLAKTPTPTTSYLGSQALTESVLEIWISVYAQQQIKNAREREENK
jgi:hypothetical protein